MHKVDLDQVKQQGYLDLSLFIWQKTILNNLPRRLRDAVEYLTKFAWREMTGALLYDSKKTNGMNIYQVQQQVLSTPQQPARPDQGPVDWVHTGLNEVWDAKGHWDSEEGLLNAVHGAADQGKYDSELPDSEQS